ncbi:unnamed protein product, partial [Cyprideis torosa]
MWYRVLASLALVASSFAAAKVGFYSFMSRPAVDTTPAPVGPSAVCNPGRSLFNLFGPLRQEPVEECGVRKNRQSPIDIQSDEATLAEFGHWDFQNYNRNFETICVFNTGSTVQWVLTASHRPSVAGGGLPGRYILEHIHVHWGRVGEGGSEHTVNGERYALEFHFVHYHERFANFEDALASSELDALAVLGALVEISDSYQPNPGIENLLPDFKAVEFPGTGDILPREVYNLHDLLPNDKTKFYRY